MASKQLLLLRHAKSDWNSAAAGDFERPLSRRGRRDAPRMGRWLVANGGLPERIVASPSARTTETVELVCATFGDAMSGDAMSGDAMFGDAMSGDAMFGDARAAQSDRVIYDRRLYHGGPEQIREIAAEQLQSFDRVLIVAHNPGMELALLAYCPEAEPFADGKLMPTCALAVIEFAADADAATATGGKLRALLRPPER